MISVFRGPAWNTEAKQRHLVQLHEEDLATHLEVALEGRRRVKEQLKKMLPFEFCKTSFSFIDRETRGERFVGIPEEGGRDLIQSDPPSPGVVYTAAVGHADPAPRTASSQTATAPT